MKMNAAMVGLNAWGIGALRRRVKCVLVGRILSRGAAERQSDRVSPFPPLALAHSLILYAGSSGSAGPISSCTASNSTRASNGLTNTRVTSGCARSSSACDAAAV
jgi:hypothetical protein